MEMVLNLRFCIIIFFSFCVCRSLSVFGGNWIDKFWSSVSVACGVAWHAFRHFISSMWRQIWNKLLGAICDTQMAHLSDHISRLTQNEHFSAKWKIIQKFVCAISLTNWKQFNRNYNILTERVWATIFTENTN